MAGISSVYNRHLRIAGISSVYHRHLRIAEISSVYHRRLRIAGISSVCHRHLRIAGISTVCHSLLHVAGIAALRPQGQTAKHAGVTSQVVVRAQSRISNALVSATYIADAKHSNVWRYVILSTENFGHPTWPL